MFFCERHVNWDLLILANCYGFQCGISCHWIPILFICFVVFLVSYHFNHLANSKIGDACQITGTCHIARPKKHIFHPPPFVASILTFQGVGGPAPHQPMGCTVESTEAKVEVQGVNGATPLYVAALNGHKEVLNILLEAFWGKIAMLLMEKILHHKKCMKPEIFTISTGAGFLASTVANWCWGGVGEWKFLVDERYFGMQVYRCIPLLRFDYHCCWVRCPSKWGGHQGLSANFHGPMEYMDEGSESQRKEKNWPTAIFRWISLVCTPPKIKMSHWKGTIFKWKCHLPTINFPGISLFSEGGIHCFRWISFIYTDLCKFQSSKCCEKLPTRHPQPGSLEAKENVDFNFPAMAMAFEGCFFCCWTSQVTSWSIVYGGRNPTHQLRLVVYYFVLQGWISSISGGFKYFWNVHPDFWVKWFPIFGSTLFWRMLLKDQTEAEDPKFGYQLFVGKNTTWFIRVQSPSSLKTTLAKKGCGRSGSSSKRRMDTTACGMC